MGSLDERLMCSKLHSNQVNMASVCEIGEKNGVWKLLVYGHCLGKTESRLLAYVAIIFVLT